MHEAGDGSGGGGGDLFTPPPGDPGTIRSAARDLGKHSTAAGDLAHSARRISSGLDESDFSGQSATAYHSFSGKIEKASSGTEAPLSSMGRSLGQYADLLEDTQRKVRDAAHRNQAAVKRGQKLADDVNSNPHRTDAEVSAAQTKIDAANADAQTASDDAQRAWDTFDAEGKKIGDAIAKATRTLDELPEHGGLKEFLDKIEHPKDINELSHTIFDSTLGKYDKSLDELYETFKKGKGLEKDLLADAAKSRDALSSRIKALESVVDEPGFDSEEIGSQIANMSHELESVAPTVAEHASKLGIARWGTAGAGILKYGGGATGMLGDVVTAVDPPDKGALGMVDRGVAVGNAALIGASMAELAVPGGQVLLIGTGAYLAGDYLYHHWGRFRNVCNDVGHGAVTASKWVAHGAENLANSEVKAATNTYHEASHLASSGLHKLKSLF